MNAPSQAKPAQAARIIAPPARGCLDPRGLAARLVPPAGGADVLSILDSLEVLERFRAAALSVSNDQSDAVRSLLSGHAPDGARLGRPHAAFVPLAPGTERAACRPLAGVAVFLPRDTSEEDRAGARRVLSRVEHLKLGRLGVWELEPETHDDARLSDPLIGPPTGAQRWATITPLAFDRHAKKVETAAFAESMVASACRRAGLPAPREVLVTPGSVHAAIPDSARFPPLRRPDNAARRHGHVVVLFERPVVGPVLLGAGRYRGFGVFEGVR